MFIEVRDIILRENRLVNIMQIESVVRGQDGIECLIYLRNNSEYQLNEPYDSVLEKIQKAHKVQANALAQAIETFLGDRLALSKD